MSISKTLAVQVATLANIDLSDAEIVTFTEQLEQILRYVERLDALDTAQVEPTAHSVSLSCPLRADDPIPSMARETLLDQAPAHDGELLIVPKVMGS